MKIIETHIVPAQDVPIRLQEYGVSIFKSITTKSALKKAIKRKEVLINGKVAQTSDYILEEQEIQLLQQEKKIKKIFKLQLEIVFEDDFLAVVNKPSGFPTSGNYFKTIENALPYNLMPSKQENVLPYPLPAHRLDNPTSGLLIVAKTREVHSAINLAFENKEINKTYMALVHGTTPSSFIVEKEIEGRSSLTYFTTIKQLTLKGDNFSLVEAIPKTGRTHQIRIHAATKEFPIAGDNEYGAPSNSLPSKGLFLAATGLDFTHPITGLGIDLELSLPKKFSFLEKL